MTSEHEERSRAARDPRDPGPTPDPAEAGGRPSDNAPIFIVGCPRSGTSLLYHMLLSSGEFPVYLSESKVLACAAHYGSLRNAKNRRRFAEDFVRSKQFRESGLEPEGFRRWAEDECRDYTGFLRRFMDEMARSEGKRRWVEKTPAHTWRIDRLRTRFPTSKFIHIVRDGRDVALSLRRTGWTPAFGDDPLRQLLWAAEIWEATVDHVDPYADRLDGRFLTVRYEDLVRDTRPLLDTLSEFVGAPLSSERIAERKIGTLGSANTAFDDELDGVTNRPVERWRERLEPRERRALEWAVGETLRRYDYETEGSRSEGPGPALRVFAALAPRLSRLKWALKRTGLLRGIAYNPLQFDSREAERRGD